MNIQDKVLDYVYAWEAKDQYVIPDLADCLDFMMTEVSEAIEKRLRTKLYVRNNPEPIPSKEEIAIEVFDAIMMGCIALDLLGFDLDEVAEKKLRYMDDKRRSE